ncbi:MAG: hypothetical protein K2H09_06705 [Treponemataceae bacterium]|nr:hypothetical protein [Treponemataceae bacterium]
MDRIINDGGIDEQEAREWLSREYSGLNLLPRVPDECTAAIIAAVLDVSALTVERMLRDGQIALTRRSLEQYIQTNLLANRPVDFNN